MNEIWQLRGSVQRDIRRAETSELLSANLDCVEGVLGEDDIDAIVDVVKASREKYKKDTGIRCQKINGGGEVPPQR